ncbi:MAG: glycosyltransferase [bacterium]|nr:glycosyltransferase [bacterium]
MGATAGQLCGYCPFMRILHVITDLETGGVPLHLLRLAGYLHGRGDAVRVVSLAPPGPVSEQLELAGVETGACDAAGWWDWRAVDRLAGIIREFRPDLVHALLFHANIAARLACALAGFDAGRLICEIQTVEVERRWHLAVDRWTQRLCRWTVGNSPSVLEHLARGGIDRSRLRLIWGGVDVEALQAADPIDRQALADLGLDAGRPLLLWVGRLDPIKGLDVLVRAIALIRRTQPVQLAIVGDGPYREELEACIAANDLGESVRLLGMRGDVASWLQAADVFVFPSRTEGLPNALLEAMAVGLPVVTTDVAGCRDLIRHGRTGLLVPADDAAALAAAVLRLHDRRPFARCLGEAAADHVRRRHRREACFEAYRALYRQTLTGNAPAG